MNSPKKKTDIQQSGGHKSEVTSSIQDVRKKSVQKDQRVVSRQSEKGAQVTILEVERLKREKERYSRQCMQLEHKIAAIKEELEDTQNEYIFQKNSIEEQIQAKKDDFNRLQKKEEDYRFKLQDLNQELLRIDKKISLRKKDGLSQLNQVKEEHRNLVEKNVDLESNIDQNRKRFRDIQDEVDLKERSLKSITQELESKSVEIKTLNEAYDTLCLEYEQKFKSLEELDSQKNELETAILDLSDYQNSLENEKELAFLALKSDIEAEKQKYEYERKVRFKQLSQKLSERERKWEKDFFQKQQKLESELNKKKIDQERKYNEFINELDDEKEHILVDARFKADAIKKDADRIIQESFKERQRLLDEGSQQKMEALNYAAEEVRKAQEEVRRVKEEADLKRNEADQFCRSKAKEAEIVLDSARSKSSLILKNAEKERKKGLSEVEARKKAVELELSQLESDFQEEIKERKKRLKHYFALKKERFFNHLDSLKSAQDQRFKKLHEHNLLLIEKSKRKELKKLVSFKDRIVSEARSQIEKEQRAHKEKRKHDIQELYKAKKDLLLEKESLEHEIEEKYRKLTQQKEEELLRMDKVHLEKTRLRTEELENEYKNRINDKEKELSKRFKDDEKQMRDSIISYIEENFEYENLNIRNDINEIFDFKRSQKKKKLLEQAGLDNKEVKEKNISNLFWAWGVKLALPSMVVSVFAFDFMDARTRAITFGENFIAKMEIETKKNDDDIIKQVQEQKQYNPKMTAEYKDSYVENVLHTTNFVKVYESSEFQNDWLLAAYEFLSGELELNEEIAINFVSSEGALIKELSDMKSKIELRFLDNELDKMKNREAEVMNSQKEKFHAPENWKAFMAFRDQFYAKHFK